MYMDYKSHYDKLIDKRRQQAPDGYTENHHIVMKSMGGTDEAENLVRLTGREHWVAHLLLHKIHRNPKTAHACHMMAMRCEERGIPEIKNSRTYERIRKTLISAWSKRGKKRVGKKNGSFGRSWYHNPGTGKSMKCLPKEKPSGWIAGRVQKPNFCTVCGVLVKSRQRKYCNSCRPTTHSKPRKASHSKNPTHIYEITSPAGEVFIIDNLTKFCKEHGLQKSNLCCVVNGKPNYKQHKGYTGHILKTNQK